MPLQIASNQTVPASPIRGGDVLACGFAMTVAEWLAAYVTRLPTVQAPGIVTFIAMLAVIFIGGMLTARYARGIPAALCAGGISGVLNNLLVGSLLHEVAGKAASALPATLSATFPATQPTTLEAPAVALWVGGSLLGTVLVAGAGGLLGSFFPVPLAERRAIQWTQVFAIVLAAATLSLLAMGGLVTANQAGMAVPDWPQSYGYNMFLFPLSKMQSNPGNFYEHAHRLMASLVGFTALALAIHTTVAKRRRSLIILAWAIGFGILIQAILGGTRVTEHNVNLALAHGVFAQLVFAAMACLAAAASAPFLALPKSRRPTASTDRLFTTALLASLIVQLILGAFVRHKDKLTMLHITMAIFVTFLVLASGIRAWGLNPTLRPLKFCGLAILALVALQLILGILALTFRTGPAAPPTLQSAYLTTAHQANGALLLAFSAALTLWTWQLVKPGKTEPAA